MCPIVKKSVEQQLSLPTIAKKGKILRWRHQHFGHNEKFVAQHKRDVLKIWTKKAEYDDFFTSSNIQVYEESFTLKQQPLQLV